MHVINAKEETAKSNVILCKSMSNEGESKHTLNFPGIGLSRK